MGHPELSIVIPAFNAADDLVTCLRALNQQTVSRSRYEIIVVSDGSTDGTAEVARQEGADQVLVQPHRGPAAARNAGVKAAHGDVVLFTDADCEPSPEWLERMVAPFTDPRVMGTKGTYRTRQRARMARLVQLEYEVRYQRMLHRERIDFIDTYAAAYRRDLLLQCGGFDPTYPPSSAEDVDLAFRLVRAGHWLVFVPEAWVWHRHPESLRAYLGRKSRYGFWRARLYLRYPEKIGGDVHTDPALKVQFVLVALAGLLGLGGVFWWPLAVAGGAALLAFLGTTLPFVRRAWPHDRVVAWLWPVVSLLRVAVQGAGLAAGLIYHGLVSRQHLAGDR